MIYIMMDFEGFGGLGDVRVLRRVFTMLWLFICDNTLCRVQYRIYEGGVFSF